MKTKLHFKYLLFIFKIKFLPSKFLCEEESIGEIITEKEKSGNNWLNDSLILNENEKRSLIEMTKSTNGTLLYRATRDGFSAQAFHSKCDDKVNTITIIKNNLNYVFGGYASSAWKSSRGSTFVSDNNAFVFSLRRNGESKNEKFMINNSTYALQMNTSYGPIFGCCDIIVENNSNVVADSQSNFGYSYKKPDGSEITNCYLVGHQGYLTVDIEVYQIN